MIKVKYLPNRFSKDGRVEKDFPFRRGLSVGEYVDYVHEIPKMEKESFDVIVSGRVSKNLKEIANDHDEITVTPKIKDPFTVGSIVYAALTEAGIGATMATAIGVAAMVGTAVVEIGLVAYSIYSAVTAGQRMPTFDVGGSGIDESSPTYGWDGISTTRSVNIPIPVVYGEHKVGGNVINEYIWTDGDKNYLNTLIALCEGEIESVSDIKVNDQPVANYDGVAQTTRMGTNAQAVIPNFQDLHNVYPVNVALTKSSAYVYTTVETDVEAFEIKLQLPSGIYQVDPSSGDIQSWDVTYQVEYKPHSAGSYTDLGSTTISGKSRTALRRIFRKDGLTAGQYDIRITKTSDDSSLSPQKTGDLYLQSVDEIKTDDLSYPNTALLGLELLATDQLSGSSPNVTCIVKGKKVSIPNVLNGATAVDWEDYYFDPDYNSGAGAFRLLSDNTVLTWDGTTYVTAWSANPIWCMKDLLTNTRYGLGNFITTSLLDSSMFVEMAKYCEEKVPDGEGGYEKRFRLDVVLDSQTKSLDVITQLCAVFNAFPFYSSGAIKLRIDKEETPTQLFGMGNIIADSFAQSWRSVRDIPNMVEVQYLDSAEDYENETVCVIDEASLSAGDPVRKKDVKIFTTSKSQAIRAARYALRVGQHIDRSVSFKAAIDAIACQCGDVINISHDVPQWGFSGRVKTGSTTTLVKLDQSVTIESGKTYSIQVRLADDTIEERTVTDAPGTYTEVNVSSAFSSAPAAFDVYAFGETSIVVKSFRVIAMSRAANDEVDISAIEYDANVYDDSLIDWPTNNYSSLSREILPVSDLKLTERMAKMSDGTIENCIDVWWQNPDMSTGSVIAFKKAKIYLSDNDGGSWSLRGETSGTHFAITGNIVAGIEYKVAVVSAYELGQEMKLTSCPSAAITLAGKEAPPSNVTGFVARQSRDRMTLSWIGISDLDLSGYEIRYGGGWDVGEVLATGIKVNIFINLNFRTGTDQSYWIKAIDTSGNYSETATEALITVENIPFTNIIEEYSEQTSWGGTLANVQKIGSVLKIGKQITSVGGAKISTSWHYAGSSSGYFDGTDDKLTAAYSADFCMGNNDFEMEMTVRFSSITNKQVFAGQCEDANNYWYISKLSNANGNKLEIGFVADGTTQASYTMTNSWSCAVDTDYTIKFVRTNPTGIKLYINDVEQTLTETVAAGSKSLVDAVAILEIAAVNGADFFNGYMDEFKISRFMGDAKVENVVLYLKFEGDNDSTVFEDSSGKTGTYETPSRYTTPVRDLGYIATFKVGIESIATISSGATLLDFPGMTLQDFPGMRLSGSEQPGALSFEIRTSDDNGTWSDWEDWQAGDYTCRYFQLRMTMSRDDLSQDLECSQFDYYADLPDVDDFGTGEVTVAADGAEITFNKEFHSAPHVNIIILTGDGYLHKFSVVPDTTGFTVKLYDLSLVAKTGTFSWAAHGT